MAKHGGIYLYSLEAKAEGLFSQVNTAYIRRYSKKTKKQNKTKKKPGYEPGSGGSYL